MEYWEKHHWHDFAVYLDLEENLISFINELKPYEEYTQRVEDFECQIELQVNILIYIIYIILYNIVNNITNLNKYL